MQFLRSTHLHVLWLMWTVLPRGNYLLMTSLVAQDQGIYLQSSDIVSCLGLGHLSLEQYLFLKQRGKKDRQIFSYSWDAWERSRLSSCFILEICDGKKTEHAEDRQLNLWMGVEDKRQDMGFGSMGLSRMVVEDVMVLNYSHLVMQIGLGNVF